MLLNNKYFISAFVIIIILFCGVTVVFFLQKGKPNNIIESKLNVKLPPSCKIVNFTYNRKEDSFNTKISIENQSVDYVKEQLNGFFGGEAPNKATERLPNFKNICPWWDLENQNIEVSYMRFVDERKWFSRKSHDVWAFISKDNNDQYYLYISY